MMLYLRSINKTYSISDRMYSFYTEFMKMGPESRLKGKK